MQLQVTDQHHAKQNGKAPNQRAAQAQGNARQQGHQQQPRLIDRRQPAAADNTADGANKQPQGDQMRAEMKAGIRLEQAQQHQTDERQRNGTRYGNQARGHMPLRRPDQKRHAHQNQQHAGADQCAHPANLDGAMKVGGPTPV